MKTSELIEKLTKLMDEKGDLEVTAYEAEDNDTYDINQVLYLNGEIVLI